MENKSWEYHFGKQSGKLSSYDNGLNSNTSDTGNYLIDEIPFALGNVLWVIMAEENSLHDYEEWATEYGVTKEGKWAAIYDGHCSCYGWEASESEITYYDSLDQLLQSDENAKVIIKNKSDLLKAYPFLQI